MNREQRRKTAKELKSKGYSKEKIDAFLNINKTTESIPEGTKVKLNIDKIKSHPDYYKLTGKYKNWVNDNKDIVFTVKYEESYGDNPNIVALLEDKTGWNFYVGDLIVVKE